MPLEHLTLRGRHPSRYVRGALALSVALAGCLPTGTATSEPLASEVASAAAAECPAIQLRSPNGASIDLNGTWASGTPEAGDRIQYEIRQSGTCLWGRGYSAFPGQEPGETFDLVLVGTVHPDFTAELDLLELHTGGPAYEHFGRASLTLEIRFEGGGTDERTVLEITALQARLVGGDTGRLFGTGGPVVGAVLTRSP